jgi:hypothetical protein
MLSNVREWCFDQDMRFYAEPRGHSAWAGGRFVPGPRTHDDRVMRKCPVIKGGKGVDETHVAYAATRHAGRPEHAMRAVGFRLAIGSQSLMDQRAHDFIGRLQDASAMPLPLSASPHSTLRGDVLSYQDVLMGEEEMDTRSMTRQELEFDLAFLDDSDEDDTCEMQPLPKASAPPPSLMQRVARSFRALWRRDEKS